MAEVDPVILELRAELTRYRNELRATTTIVDRSLQQQERRVVSLERQFARSSAEIGGKLRLLAGAFAGAFSAQQLTGLVDGYTRLQNSLRVAGLEGESLASVQENLLGLSSRYGVSLEALAGLFGNATQAGQELGASQSQILGLTEATSQALLITGTSAVSASGAILGLNQALASGTVRAEEFNQINEGGLRPLLQAAANAERFGGSVAKLRAAVLDGKVSSQEFFTAILNGSAALEGQAAKATLTLSGAFEALNSRLTVYVGQSAQANGASAALANGIKLLADNLDLVANALAVIAAAIVGRYVAALGAAAAGQVALARSAAGATTALGTMGAVAATTGRALLVAFGGPVGLAITAVTIAIGYAATRTTELERAQESLTRATEAAAAVVRPYADAVDRLATLQGKARNAALANARALREEAIQAREAARAVAVLAKAEALRLQGQARLAAERTRVAANDPRLAPGIDKQRIDREFADARESFRQSADTFNAINAEVRRLDAQLAAGAPPAVSGGEEAGKKTKTRAGKSAEQLANEAARTEAQFQDELARSRVELLRAQADLTGGIQAQYAATIAAIDADRESYRRQLQLDDQLTQAQRDELLAARDAVLAKQRQIAEQDLNAAEAQRAAELDQIALDLRAQEVALAGEFVDSAKGRAAIELELLDIADRQREIDLQRIIETEKVNSALAQRAQAELDALRASRGQREAAVLARNEGPAGRYMRELTRSADAINEDIEAISVQALDKLNDGLTEAIMGTKSLGDVFKGVANQIIADLIRIAVQQQIIKPLANALFGGGGGGGGGGDLFAAIGSAIGGRQSGGYMPPNSVRRVNEGRGSGVELLRVGPQGGTVIPLGQANAVARPAQAAPAVVQVVVDEGALFRPTIRQVSGDVSVQVVRQSAPQIARAGADIAITEQAKLNRYGSK
ncbi:tape measure protein [Sphingomonas baiyangensis]|uniref:Tape measure protein N-terminal domain-containing protein n=1 Tax=Sphingomonas baiyangensis TaxID=2572576 RepID=A0A4U1L2H8_9SPHN|nr:tape measure protein [Sphingomonas baiyangensis]TKD50225.1 hypothetical protein FBR43_05240 [Sphingomonas baiyangensis]